MARLLDEILKTVFNLQQRFLEMNDTTTIEYIIFERFGETEETISALNELQNIRERADFYYSRFQTILRLIYSSQPVVSRANLELLTQTVEEAEATTQAFNASV